MIVFFRNENLAKNICIGLFGFFTAITLYVAVTTKFTPAYDVIHHLGTELYISPWTRIIPYLVGVAAGWYLYTSNGVLALEKVRLFHFLENKKSVNVGIFKNM